MKTILTKNTALLQKMLTFQDNGTDLYNLILSQIKENLDELQILALNENGISEFKIIPLRARVRLNLDNDNLGYLKNIKSAVFRDLIYSIEKEAMIFEVDKNKEIAEGLIYVAVKKD